MAYDFKIETITKSAKQYVVRIESAAGSSDAVMTFAFHIAGLAPKAQVNGIEVKASMGPVFRFPFAVGGKTYQWEVKTDTAGMGTKLKRVEILADGQAVHSELVS